MNFLLHQDRIPQLAAVIVTLAAVCVDLRWRRIPNTLTLGAAAVATCFHAIAGKSGLPFVFSGMGVGLAVFLPVFLLGGMGGGDVKLMGALGAWLGGWGVFETALWAACWGGCIAVAMFAARGGWRRILRIPSDIAALLILRARLQPDPSAPSFPYSVAIFAGLMTVLAGRGIQ